MNHISHFKKITLSTIFLSVALFFNSNPVLADTLLNEQNTNLILKVRNGGQVVALDAQTKQQKWIFGSECEILTPPIALEDLVIVKAHDGRVYGLDPEDGDVRWFYQQTLPNLTLHQDSPPLVTTTRVYIGFPDATVVALNRQTGAVIWITRTAIPKGESPMARLVDIVKPLSLDGDILTVVSYPNNKVQLDRETGQIL